MTNTGNSSDTSGGQIRRYRHQNKAVDWTPQTLRHYQYLL